MQWDKDTLVSVVSAIFGSSALTAYITNKATKKQDAANAASTTVDSILKWANEMSDRIKSLESLIESKNNMIQDLSLKIAHLEAVIEDLREKVGPR